MTSDMKFKIVPMDMLKCLVWKVGNMHDPLGNSSRHLETIRKTQMVKHISKGRKNAFDALNGSNTAEESIRELKQGSNWNYTNWSTKKKKWKSNELRTMNKLRTKLNNLKYMSPETQRDKRWDGENEILEEITMRLSQNYLYRPSLD